MRKRNSLLRSVGALSVGCLIGCGGGGSDGGDGVVAGPFAFAAGPTTIATVDPGLTGPIAFRDLELADADDDGIQDVGYVVATGGAFTFSVTAMPGVGDGSFGPIFSNGATYTPLSGPPILSKGSVLGVGQEGFVVFATGFGTGVVTLGWRDGGTTMVGGAEAEDFGNGPAVADFNGDGVDDVAMVDATANEVVEWFSKGETGLWPPWRFPAPPPGGTGMIAIAAGRFDANATNDVIVFSGEGGGYATFVGPLAEQRIPFASAQYLFDPVTGDFDGDGDQDVAGVVFESGQPVSLGLLRGNGDGTFVPLLLTTPTEVTLNLDVLPHVHAGDLDGDGLHDLALIIPGGDQTCVFLGTATGQFSFYSDPLLIGGGNDVLAIGDVDNDGDLDLVIGNAATLAVRTLLNQRF